MIVRILIVFLSFSVVSCGSQHLETGKTILFIGAHPDDETAISEALYKFSKSGNTVYVMIATDGKNGTRVTDIPAGDSLGKLRRDETICSCKVLGLELPVYLGIERLDTKIGVGEYFKAHRQLIDSLKRRISTINPDVIIAAGPDGDTHHSEHIVVGAAVTELLLTEGWVEKYPLYYFAFKKDPSSDDHWGYVDEKYVNVKVKYSAEETEKALDALRCYVTQFTAEEINEEAERKRNEKDKTIYFRKFVVLKGVGEDFE